MPQLKLVQNLLCSLSIFPSFQPLVTFNSMKDITCINFENSNMEEHLGKKINTIVQFIIPRPRLNTKVAVVCQII